MKINHISEKELFNKSVFVLKIKGYTFHSREIYEDVCHSLGKIKEKTTIDLDYNDLREYRRQHGEYKWKNADEVTIINLNSKNYDIAIARHESGAEIFFSIATGIAASVLYDIIKAAIKAFKESIEKQNKRYVTELDFEAAEILLIKKKYTIKIGVINKITPNEFKVVYYLDDERELQVIKSFIINDTLSKNNKAVIEIIAQNNLIYKRRRKSILSILRKLLRIVG